MDSPIERLLQELLEGNTELTSEKASQLLGLKKKEASKMLGRLISAGVLRKNGNKYIKSNAHKTLTGTIRHRRRKVIDFIPDDASNLKDGSHTGKIRIDPSDLNGAFDGDRVAVKLLRAPKGKDREASVEMIIQRGTLKIVGRLHCRYNRFFVVESLDEKFPHKIDVEKHKDIQDKDEWIVLVEVTEYGGGYGNPKGKIIEFLGESSAYPGMDIVIVIQKHDLPHIFPLEVLTEIESVSTVVPEEHTKGRLDLRDVPTVTIDGETARDFDDAITLKKLDNGNFYLGVHIADVSFYVRAGTALDNEARTRGTSVYFPERAIPMLPEKLSNGICSLNPQVDRLTMSAMMEINQHGKVVNYEIKESVIRSNERMTYTDVNSILSHSDAEMTTRYSELIDLFKVMEELAQILITMRAKRGAIDFNLPEAVFKFDDEGYVEGVLKADRNIAHRIIEEFMLLANETVAGHTAKSGLASIYRIHEEPESQRVIEFSQLARAFGYSFPVENISSKSYQKLSKQLEGKPEEKILTYAMLRSLQRARYSSKNEGHFGLAAPVYTHFTSPIRRYPDLIVHRILRHLFKEDSSKAMTGFEVEMIADESSERERTADAAEREIAEWRKSVFMSHRIGEEFDGIIVNVKEFGFFVELEELFIEGLVHVSALWDDYYEFNQHKHALVGEVSNRTFKIGDKIRVRVNNVNTDRHLVDFTIVQQQKEKKSSPIPKNKTKKKKSVQSRPSKKRRKR